MSGTGDTATVAWLVDLEQLRRFPQRYARAVDTKDIDAVGELFHADGTVEGLRGAAAVPAYLEGMRQAPALFDSSMHFLGEPLIELSPGATEATMDTYAVVYQLRAAGSAEGDLVLGMRYQDQLQRRDGRWAISYRRATALWTRTMTAG